MIKIVIAEDAIPSVNEVLDMAENRRLEREKEIAPAAKELTDRAIAKISKGLKYTAEGKFDIMRDEAGWKRGEMSIRELVELSDEIVSLYASKGYKAAAFSFSVGYKVLRRIVVSVE